MCDLYRQNISTAIESREPVKKISCELLVLLTNRSMSHSLRHSPLSQHSPELLLNLV